MRSLATLPFPVLLAAVAGLAMAVPALYGFATGDAVAGRAFVSQGLLLLVLCAMIGLATAGDGRGARSPRVYLWGLLASLFGLPAALALPMAEAVPDTRFVNLYVEMVAALTTTGGSVFADPLARLGPTLMLWKALVAWLGGFLFWVAALAVFAPLDLGGFEIHASAGDARRVRDARGGRGFGTDVTPRERLVRHARALAPVYGGLTAVLALGLAILGEPGLAAAVHAMSAISTSGISVTGGMQGAAAGVPGEMLVFVFLFLAVSHVTFSGGRRALRPAVLLRDREIQVALICLAVLPALLLARHWVGALEFGESENLATALRVLWGGLFTTLSFMTTTGFISAEWDVAQAWSGLSTTGLFLMGLALMGGGIATTAGGMKLLRVHALYKHGLREMERLTHPSSVGGAGPRARRIRREGAFLAWVFFMLFLLSVVAVMAGLALTGVGFVPAITLAIAALSTTGPLAALGGVPMDTLGDGAKLVLAAAMVLGRVEALAILALVNPFVQR